MRNNEAAELSVILQYELGEKEAKAYKLCLMYIDKSKKFFPDYQHCRLPKGNPTKSELFRHCHKLLREHEADIKDEDLELYVHAQFDILRNISVREGQHPRISPAVLSGEKAWKRWLLWKGKYDRVKTFAAVKTASEVIDTNRENKVINSLNSTKKYLFVMNDRLDAADLRRALRDGTFWLWVRWGKVSYYYLLLSPLVQEWLEETGTHLRDKFDVNLYLPGVTDKTKAYFRQEFSYEF
jgi:hypothetical protein